MLGVTNVGSSEVVTHYINAVGKVWEKSGSSLVISTDNSIYSSSLQTVGNVNFNDNNWPGFNFKWLIGGDADWGVGLYKVTNSKQSDKYFYLDARDSDFGGVPYVYAPDFYVHFNNLKGKYNYHERVTDDPIEVTNGAVIRVWDIKGESPNTSNLQNYWINTLVIVNKSNKPHLIWGPYPSTSISIQKYKIYRLIEGGSWQYLTYVNGSTYEYVDNSITLSQVNGMDVTYKVKGVYNVTQETSYSNSVTVNAEGSPIGKEGAEEEELTKAFELRQNYPNPFNPSTKISYSISDKSFVSLRVYNALGKEVALLENGSKEREDCEVEFDASNLPSGTYFYTLSANGERQTRKMLLIK